MARDNEAYIDECMHSKSFCRDYLAVGDSELNTRMETQVTCLGTLA